MIYRVCFAALLAIAIRDGIDQADDGLDRLWRLHNKDTFPVPALRQLSTVVFAIEICVNGAVGDHTLLQRH